MTVLLRELATAVPGAVVIGDKDTEITGVEYHSRMIQPGSLFVAIAGFRQDGNIWIEEAISRGAAAVATEREALHPVPQIIVPDARAALADFAAVFHPTRGNELPLYGVTGTNGKTTSCILLRNILAADGRQVGLITSLIYDTGRDQIPASRTTPESLELHRLLQIMRRHQCTAAVVEISSHALVLHRVKNLEIEVALFTNITRDHLDFHTSMEEYLAAKARLLDKVDDPAKWAVINYDCPEFRPFLERGRCSHLTYSLDDHAADVYLENAHLDADGSRFDLCTPAGRRTVRVKLAGRYNLYNAAAASAAAIGAGVTLDAIAAGLEQSTVVPGRLERVASAAPFAVFVDFAHTPDALTRTIGTLREIGRGRVLTLFGCGGNRDRGKRPLMGQAVTTASDYAVLTTDNPRREDPLQIIEDVKPGFAAGAAIEIIVDRTEAIRHILGRARAGDMVLLAGKGAEDYQEIMDTRHPFSDRIAAQKALQNLGFGS